MCGNDISIVDMPSDGFVQQFRTQAANGRISIKNAHNYQGQQLGLPQLSILNRLDISQVKHL